MIPLRDKLRSKTFPLVTVALILLNIYFFVRQISLGPELGVFLKKYALVPADFLSFRPISGPVFAQKGISLVSSLFLHGGWLHLIGNMWYLWVFGDNVEDKLGHFRYLLFYILCGVAGNLAHIMMNADSSIPALGASGCIAGVLGAYFLFFPRAKIVALLPILIFWTVAEVPAFFFLGIWFLIQFLSGYLSDKGQEIAAVAWWAHVGGFLSGAGLKVLLTKRR